MASRAVARLPSGPIALAARCSRRAATAGALKSPPFHSFLGAGVIPAGRTLARPSRAPAVVMAKKGQGQGKGKGKGGGGGGPKGKGGGKSSPKGKGISNNSGKPPPPKNSRAEGAGKDAMDDPDGAPTFATPPVARSIKAAPSEVLLSEGGVSPSPLWPTFSNALTGRWVGHAAAFMAETGEREVVALGPKGKGQLFDIDTVCVELRGEEGGLSRSVTRALTGGEEEEGGATDTDAMNEDDEGLVYFEDGSYSRGPITIGDDPGKVLVIEQCIGRAGHNRIRVSHTITAESHPWYDSEGHVDESAGRELDVEVLRLAVSVEHWAGPAGEGAPSLKDTFLEDEAAAKGPLTERERISPSEMNGEWRVFSRVAFPIQTEERDPENWRGRSIPAAFVYSTEETLQQWQAIDWDGVDLSRELSERALSMALEGGEGEAGGGGAISGFDDDRLAPRGEEGDFEEFFADEVMGCTVWLPESIMATVRMGGGEDDGGLTLAIEWVDKDMDGAVQCMERAYDSFGSLVDVRYSSSIRGAWAGGRM